MPILKFIFRFFICCFITAMCVMLCGIVTTLLTGLVAILAGTSGHPLTVTCLCGAFVGTCIGLWVAGGIIYKAIKGE